MNNKSIKGARKKQFAVIGLSSFGCSLARTLTEMGYDVLAIDCVEQRVQELADEITHVVQVDASDEHALEELGLRNFDVVIITTASDLRASVLITLLCKEMGVPLVVVKAHDELHAKLLKKIGADKVVFPERDMGVRLAHNLAAENVLDFIELDDNHCMVELEALPEWVGKTLQQSNIRGAYGLNVVTVRDARGNRNHLPQANDIIETGDTLLVIASREDIARLRL